MQIRPRLLIHTAAGKSLFSGSIPIRMIELVEASVSELSFCAQCIGRLYWHAGESPKNNEWRIWKHFRIKDLEERELENMVSAHILGRKYKWKTPKCRYLNFLQFECIIIKI